MITTTAFSPSLIVLFVLSVHTLAQQQNPIVPAVALTPTNYQIWAHYHWVWLHASLDNQVNVSSLLDGYKTNNIPVGAVNLDSAWSTEFNNFEVDTSKFPDFKGMIQEIHEKRNMKVIVWATSMVNVENPDYEMAVSKQFLLRNSKGEVRPIQWWHGYGGLLDYTNPEALAWWHSLIDRVLDVGVDGFKCDATDPYIAEYSAGGGALGYEDKVITYPEYASAYYSDFFYHTREKRSADTGVDSGLIMSRPVDCLADKITKVCTAHSPKDVMFSGWVGDDDGTFNGLRGCLRKLIYSAWLNYANFGCDIGGYRATDTPDKSVMIRWTQAMAFMPLMENGGAGEHRPWMFDQQTLDIYRSFVFEHHKLAAYLHTTGANAVDGGHSSVLPLDEFDPEEQAVSIGNNINFRQPTSYSYRLGEDILVHPVVWDAAENVSHISLVHRKFPYVNSDLSNTTRWLDWWAPWDKNRAHESGDVDETLIPLQNFSVFVRQGSFFPIVKQAFPSDDLTDMTNKLISFTWFGPSKNANAYNKATYDMRESITTGTGIAASAFFSSDSSIEAQISAHSTAAAGFEIVGITKPSAVTIKAWSSSQCTYSYIESTSTLTVACQSIAGGVLIYVDGVSVTV